MASRNRYESSGKFGSVNGHSSRHISMLKNLLPLDPYAQLSMHALPQARTTLSKYPQRGGKYESKEMLPSLNDKLHQTLISIAKTHKSRGRSNRTFENLWDAVCKKLKKKGNATEYSYWKLASITKNLVEFETLERKWAESFVSAFISNDASKTSPRDKIDLHAKYDKEKRAWKAKMKLQVDDILEISIAFLIEANNAFEAGEESRALHALIECWYYIGMASSPKTDSEAKSEAGAKQGKASRDMIASIATEILREIEVDKTMTDQSFLLGAVAKIIEDQHAEILEAYNKQATSGRKTVDGLGDRLTGRLTEWVNAKQQTYPELTKAYRQAHARAEQIAGASTVKKKRQANS